jgi:hypothetical protein
MRTTHDHASQPTRRQFTTALAVAVAAPLLAEEASAVAPPPAASTPANPRAASADGLVEVVRARYGKHLTEAKLKRIRASILSGLSSAERLRKVKLRNADEPAFIFSADVP